MNRKNKPGFDDVAGMAASAFEMLGGAQSKARDWMRGQTSRIVDQMDLATREECEELYEMISAARTAQEKLDKRLSVIEAQLGLKKERAPRRTARPVKTVPVKKTVKKRK